VAEVVTDPQVFLLELPDFVDNAGGLHHMADSGSRAHLEGKYGPLVVPVFRSALDGHRASQGLPADELARIDEHFTEITTRITSTYHS
jgi:hypothetical protein